MFAKKCGAKARTNNHQPCRQPAMRNGRCRLHGGKSTGPKTEDGLRRSIDAATKHGFYSMRSKRERTKAKELIKAIRNLL